jgi:MFS family permease
MSNVRRLPRNVILLGWVSFFADISSEMIYPLLPLFVVGTLGAPATVLGGIEGAAQAMVAVLTALSGWSSDRIRRRVVFVRCGYGLPVLGKTLLALATAWPMVLAGRAIDRIGKGLRTSPRDGLIADVVEADQRGRAFGFHRALDTAGALVGVLLSAALLYWFTRDGEPTSLPTAATFRWLFAIAAALGLASFMLTFMIRDDLPAHGATVQTGVQKMPLQQGAGGTNRFSRRFWMVLAILVVFSLANSSDAFLLLRAGQAGLSPVSVVLVYAVYNLSYALASYPAGALSDRFGRWRMIAAGWIIYALAYAGFAVTGMWGVWPLMALYGCSMALTDGVGKALIADHAPINRRATAFGILYLTLGLSVFVSSLLAGWLWDQLGPAAPFWFGSVAAMAAVALLIALRPYLAQDPGHGAPQATPG